MSADRYAWMDAALCAQTDPDLWTGDHSGGSTTLPKRICAHCPVRDHCDQHRAALEAHDGSPIRGIWAGHTTNQRQKNRHNDMGEAA